MVAPSHLAYLVVAVATHALVGYTLGSVAFDAPRAGLLGGVVADIDLILPLAWTFPLTHRGITHTALAACVAVAVAATLSRAAAKGVAVGYVSHVLVDSTTPMGVPVAYPVSATYVGFDTPFGGHSDPVTVVLWGCCLAVLWHRRRARPA
ncbi:metal-dependent hydrolase [Halopelagius inordinatus]|uniref:metal-dependent hydrolase n=1 Tax=Halopelagius inordinatus TaxID=553467 RepID=UPI0015A5621F|nr:metal-dependent hydrolase [Halopelagius inordinatus]